MRHPLVIARFLIQRLWPGLVALNFVISAFTLDAGSAWWASRPAIATWMLIGATAALVKLTLPRPDIVWITVPVMAAVCFVRAFTLAAGGVTSTSQVAGVTGWIRTAVAIVCIGAASSVLDLFDERHR